MASSGTLRRVALVRTDVSEGYVPPKRLYLQEPHGTTSQKTSFFIVTAVKTSILTWCYPATILSVNTRMINELYEMTKTNKLRGP
jgi:hypothetical protein